MVYALKTEDVPDVIVNGKLAVRNTKILTLDESAIPLKAEEYRAKITASLATRQFGGAVRQFGERHRNPQTRCPPHTRAAPVWCIMVS
jgi:hypothetical protein